MKVGFLWFQFANDVLLKEQYKLLPAHQYMNEAAEETA